MWHDTIFYASVSVQKRQKFPFTNLIEIYFLKYFLIFQCFSHLSEFFDLFYFRRLYGRITTIIIGR